MAGLPLPAVEEEFVEKTCPHNGPAQLLKVYGKSIAWAQLGKVQNSVAQVYGITRTKVDELTLHYSGTSSRTTTYTGTVGIYFTQGHKYYIAVNALPTGCTISGVATFASKSTIYTSNTSGNNTLGVVVPSGVQVDDDVQFYVIDLTLLYGEGHEPTSVDEALRLLGGDAFDPTYDPGSLQSNKTAELRAYDGGNLRGSLALNLSTLTGKLNGEGQSVAVFPDGMRGVGDIRDEAYGSTGEVARAVVDLGLLNWVYSARGFFASTSNLPNLKNQTVGYLLSNLACSKYAQDTASNIYSGVNDKVIGTASGGSNFWVRDSAYTDAATFKAAMSGVIVDYPIVTPLTYTLDTPLPTDLTCEQGDILQRVSGNNCPFVGDIEYKL